MARTDSAPPTYQRLLSYQMPFVLGHDVAWVVAQVGSAVRNLQAGAEVYARPRDLRIGTFAEYISIDQDDVAPKPATLTLHEAAAGCLAGPSLTAPRCSPARKSTPPAALNLSRFAAWG